VAWTQTKRIRQQGVADAWKEAEQAHQQALARALGQAKMDCQHDIAAIQTEADAKRDRFMQNLRHELTKPLAAARAAFDDIRDTITVDLTDIESKIDDIVRLSDDLDELYNLETGTQPPKLTQTNTYELLQEAVDRFQKRATSTQRDLNLFASPQLSFLYIDKKRIERALDNLLDNAFKFTKPKGKIVVQALEEGTTLMLQVADTGRGIPKEDLPHVWEPLYRSKNVWDVGGSGLGLPIVRAIVQRHGGEISIHCPDTGGTVVTIRLPITRP
jgi:signal transduction histidine kinase